MLNLCTLKAYKSLTLVIVIDHKKSDKLNVIYTLYILYTKNDNFCKNFTVHRWHEIYNDSHLTIFDETLNDI